MGSEMCIRDRGMGLLGNALVAYSLCEKGFNVVLEPIVVESKCRNIIEEGALFDVAFRIRSSKEFIVLLEVKLYRKASENVPAFNNVDKVYERIGTFKLHTVLRHCNAIPIGVILELASLPKKAKLAPYILRVDKVQGKRACKRIYNAIIGFLERKNIL